MSGHLRLHFPAHFPRARFRFRFPKGPISDARLSRAWAHVPTETLAALVALGPQLGDGDRAEAEAVHEARSRALALRLPPEPSDGALERQDGMAETAPGMPSNGEAK